MMDASKLKLPLVMVVSLLSAVAGGAATAAVVKQTVDATAAKVEVLDSERQRQALEQVRTEERLRAMQASLERIERRLGTK